MSSTFHNTFAALAEPLLAQQFGETVTRHPLGDLAPGQAASVEGVLVDRSAEDLGLMLGPSEAQMRNDEGAVQFRQWILNVPAAAAVDDRDKWTVDGQVWNTLRVLGQNCGRRDVLIQRPLPVSSRRTRVRD